MVDQQAFGMIEEVQAALENLYPGATNSQEGFHIAPEAGGRLGFSFRSRHYLSLDPATVMSTLQTFRTRQGVTLDQLWDALRTQGHN